MAVTQDVRVAVIGGGIVGASVLYWLARLGCSDTVLIERRELTSGSTWHAAGNTTYFGPYPEMTRLFAGSIRTYLAAETESGQAVGFHETGSLRLAASPRELELYHSYVPHYADMGLPYKVITNEQITQLHPFVDTGAIYGAAHTPTDGHVDPVGATQALAKAARARGASVERHRPVTALHRDGDIWVLETETGVVRAANIVVATSFWAREMLAPLGLNVPLYATEHHEFITEAVPQIAALAGDLPALRDSWTSCNMRQEGQGFLIGVYESDPVFWALDGIPKDFIEELLAPNFERLMPHMERLMERVPVLSKTGIKTVNNGPMCFTPDGLPMLGPMPGYPGLWLASGFNVGIGTGGGSGEFLAHWMVNGRTPFELPAVHADRFGNEMTREAALDAIGACYRKGYTLPEDK